METQTGAAEQTPTLAELDGKRSAPAAHKGLPTPDIFTKFLVLEGWSHWFFRLGFASIFFVNALYAVFEPTSFSDVLEQNIIASKIGQIDLLVKFAIINDLLLSIFIVGGWRKQMVYTWAGAWLLMPAGLKLMNLVF
jgi:hypothetical protein